MIQHLVITIGRELGSAGREIGFHLSRKLGIKCYDEELLALASKESGMCEELFEANDEKPNHSFLYNLVMDMNSFGYSSMDMPISQKVFLAQFNTIKNLAEKESCIIVGRCADYALENEEHMISVFIHGNLDTRVKRIMEKRQLDEDAARNLIAKTDKTRASYYNYYTSKKWGESKSYTLSIDSGALGIDGTVDFLYQFALAHEAKLKK